VNLTIAQLLAQLNKNPHIAATLADTRAHDLPALGLLEAQLAQLVFHEEQVCTCGWLEV